MDRSTVEMVWEIKREGGRERLKKWGRERESVGNDEVCKRQREKGTERGREKEWQREKQRAERWATEGHQWHLSVEGVYALYGTLLSPSLIHLSSALLFQSSLPFKVKGLGCICGLVIFPVSSCQWWLLACYTISGYGETEDGCQSLYQHGLSILISIMGMYSTMFHADIAAVCWHWKTIPPTPPTCHVSSIYLYSVSNISPALTPSFACVIGKPCWQTKYVFIMRSTADEQKVHPDNNCRGTIYILITPMWM